MLRAELAALLNTLLESERAGAKALAAFLDDPRLAPEAHAVLQRVQHDEARNCGVLIDLLATVGYARSHATGPFLQRALAIAEIRPRLELLNRGQAWVERAIEAALPRIADARVRDALDAMRASHGANIAACAALLAEAAGRDPSSNGAPPWSPQPPA
jgi:nitronate monooxygenase